MSKSEFAGVIADLAEINYKIKNIKRIVTDYRDKTESEEKIDKILRKLNTIESNIAEVKKTANSLITELPEIRERLDKIKVLRAEISDIFKQFSASEDQYEIF